MEASGIAQLFEGKTIFITGATGFLAKILVEKILRIQPNVKKLYLVIRANNSRSSGQRLYEEIIETELFSVLREKWGAIRLSSLISEKVVPVSGDVSCENLGIQDLELRDQMWKDIDIIVNSAASTKFDERYDVAFGINTLGAMHALNFAKKCVKIKVLLHVSTAYVCGEQAGLIPEEPLCSGGTLGGTSYIDIDAERKLVVERLKELEAWNDSLGAIRSGMKDLGTQRAKLHGWPNTYVFTKAMGEIVLDRYKGNLEVAMVRPTIVTSTQKEPFPGWIEGVRTLDSLLVAYGRGHLKYYLGNPEATIDLIPGDVVVNSILAAVTAHGNESCDQYIYHIGSSRRNPIKYGEIHHFFYSYFSMNPWVNDKGKPVKVGKVKVLSSMAKFHSYISIRSIPLLKVLKLINVLTCGYFEAMYTNFKRKINSVMRLAELYKPYMFFQGVFDDTNAANLQLLVPESESKTFNFDPMCIEWKHYFMNIHIPGAVKYLF